MLISLQYSFMNSKAEVVLLTACEKTSFKDLPFQGFCQQSLPFHAKNQFIPLLILNKCRILGLPVIAVGSSPLM